MTKYLYQFGYDTPDSLSKAGWYSVGGGFNTYTDSVSGRFTKCVIDTVISPPIIANVTTLRAKRFGWFSKGLVTSCTILAFYDSSAQKQLYLQITDVYSIQLYCGSTLLATTDNGVIKGVEVFNIEMLATCSTTAGSVKVWLNGVHLSALDISNGKTQNTTLNNYRYVGSEGSYGANNTLDLVIDDAPDDTPIGAKYVFAAPPASDVASSNVTPSTGTSAYAMVAKTNPAGPPATYDNFIAVGAYATFGLATLPDWATAVSAVNIAYRARSYPGSGTSLAPSITDGTNTLTGDTTTFGTSVTGARYAPATAPDGTAWSKTKLAATNITLMRGSDA